MVPRARIGVWRWEPATGVLHCCLEHAIPPLNPLLAPAGSPPESARELKGPMVMDEITEEPGALVERIAALDIGKATLTVCARVPHDDKPGARRQERRA